MHKCRVRPGHVPAPWSPDYSAKVATQPRWQEGCRGPGLTRPPGSDSQAGLVPPRPSGLQATLQGCPCASVRCPSSQPRTAVNHLLHKVTFRETNARRGPPRGTAGTYMWGWPDPTKLSDTARLGHPDHLVSSRRAWQERHPSAWQGQPTDVPRCQPLCSHGPASSPAHREAGPYAASVDMASGPHSLPPAHGRAYCNPKAHRRTACSRPRCAQGAGWQGRD